MCKFIIIFTILCSVCFAQAQNVSLSGVVKLSNGTPVDGVTISLAGLSSLSALTKSDGTFSLNKTITSVKSFSSNFKNLNFTLQENSILFSHNDLTTSLDVKVYSNNGRILAARTIPAHSTANSRISLPTQGSGMYYVSLKTDNMEIVRPLIQVGKKLFFESGTAESIRDNTLSANMNAIDAVVDTLIVKKEGYSTVRYPLASYEQQNIEVTIEIEDTYSGNISNLSVRANPNSVVSAYVSWTTDKAATSKVQFGENSLQWEISDEAATTKHEVLVIGMHAKTKYKIRAISGQTNAETSFTTGTLPVNVPEGTVSAKSGSQPGWTLVNVLHGTGQSRPISKEPAAAVMYDHDGRVVWYQLHGKVADYGGCTSTEYYEKDKTVIIGATDTEAPREYDLSGKILWEGPSPKEGGDYSITHHVGKISNGNYILVGWEADKAGSFGGGLTWANLREVNKSNQVVWEWHLKDFITVPGTASSDYFHANSATVFPERNEVYFNCRWIGLIKTTYKNPTLIYHLPASYNTASPANISFSPSQSQFSDTHDPEIHLDDSTVMFFDNGGYSANMSGSYTAYHSRIVEYKIDEVGKKATLKWEFPGTINNDTYFKNDFYMPYWGDADRLENNNVLFTASTMGANEVSHLFEVTRAGQVVWDFSLPADNGMYRAQRIANPPLVKAINQ